MINRVSHLTIPRWRFQKLSIGQKTFQVLANTCSQQEQQQPQVPQIPVAVPSPQAPVPSLRGQQGEINRLTDEAEEWLAEESHRVQKSTMYYHTLGRH